MAKDINEFLESTYRIDEQAPEDRIFFMMQNRIKANR